MRRPNRAGVGRRADAALVIAVVVALLAGCAPSEPDLSTAAATRLQSDVLAATRASAAGDLPAARAALATLTQTVASTARSGGVSARRRQAIEASIAAVAADLTVQEAQRAAQATADAAAAAAAVKAAEQDRAAADAKGDSGRGKGDKSKE